MTGLLVLIWVVLDVEDKDIAKQYDELVWEENFALLSSFRLFYLFDKLLVAGPVDIRPCFDLLPFLKVLFIKDSHSFQRVYCQYQIVILSLKIVW